MSGADPRDDRELLAAYARRDEGAFGVFYDRHARAVYGALFRVLGRESDAEEAMQEVFVRASLKWRAIIYADGSARSWLLGVGRNVASDQLRAARRRPVETALTGSEPTIPSMTQLEERLDQVLEVRDVEREVARMDRTDQRIYRAAFLDGLSHVETAHLLGLNAAAVRKRFQRIRDQLRALRGETG